MNALNRLAAFAARHPLGVWQFVVSPLLYIAMFVVAVTSGERGALLFISSMILVAYLLTLLRLYDTQQGRP